MDRPLPKDPWNFTAAAFQQRRRDTWRAIRIWLVVEALAVATFLTVGSSKTHAIQTSSGPLEFSVRYITPMRDLTLWQLNTLFGSFVVMGAAVIAITYAIKRHYRCPKCEAIPMGSWTMLGPSSYGISSGVALNPSVCRKCGARLR
jgi:hypothetical protein